MSEAPIIDKLIEDMELQGIKVGGAGYLNTLPKTQITNSYHNHKRIIEAIWSRRKING